MKELKIDSIALFILPKIVLSEAAIGDAFGSKLSSTGYNGIFYFPRKDYFLCWFSREQVAAQAFLSKSSLRLF